MNIHSISNVTGYSGIIAVLTSIKLTEALQAVSLTLGIVFLILGCFLRCMEIIDRQKKKRDDP